jgi:hypothetical protein
VYGLTVALSLNEEIMAHVAIPVMFVIMTYVAWAHSRATRVMNEPEEILCDKDGEKMQEISVNEISGDVGHPVRVYSCPKCGQVKMIPKKL